MHLKKSTHSNVHNPHILFCLKSLYFHRAPQLLFFHLLSCLQQCSFPDQHTWYCTDQPFNRFLDLFNLLFHFFLPYKLQWWFLSLLLITKVTDPLSFSTISTVGSREQEQELQTTLLDLHYKNRKNIKNIKRILQGLGVDQAAVTKRWQ